MGNQKVGFPKQNRSFLGRAAFQFRWADHKEDKTQKELNVYTTSFHLFNKG
jgi:hypothetical protein